MQLLPTAQTTSSPSEASMMLTTKQAAAHLSLSVSTLNKWRCYGTGPKYLKLGRAVRYSHDELNRFLAERLYSSTLGR